MENQIGCFIVQRRKELGFTQQSLAKKLNVSFQAVSKWEKGMSIPDVLLLPQLAGVLDTSVDALLGYNHVHKTIYEEKYREEKYYWGTAPSKLCYEVMKLRPPVKPYRVLDIGCGEGKNAVFFAKNGYQVSAFDIADSGLEKARKLAEDNCVEIDFFKGDVNVYEPHKGFDIIFSSGVLHYMPQKQRKGLFERLKKCTSTSGIHAMNVFVDKPFIEMAPDYEDLERRIEPWYSGELFRYYHDWFFHKLDETIQDCNSSGIPHRHCMNIMIAEKM